MNIAVVKAGGVGSRIAGKGDVLPKQFIEICGKPIIIYSLEPYQRAKNVDEIVIACHEKYIDMCWDYVKKYEMTKVTHIVAGGDSAQDSFFKGVEAVADRLTKDDIVLMTDAVRPIVSSDTVNEVVEAAKVYGAAGGGVRAAECCFYYEDLKEEKFDYLKNDNVMLSKTPQALTYENVYQYHDDAKRMGIYENCPAFCGLSINTGHKFKFVADCPYNVKITYPEQLEFFRMVVENNLLEAFRNMRSKL